MPRNVRNFWIEGNVDGRATHIGIGPQSQDGGFSLRILIRENGDISPRVLRIDGRALSDGKLVVDVSGDGARLVSSTHGSRALARDESVSFESTR